MDFPPFCLSPQEFQPLLVGVSGGADSLALLHSLHQAGVPVIAAHFNHQLRPDAAADADFVCALAAGLGLPCVVGQGDVAGLANRESLSLEEAARKLRYRFLFEQAHRYRARAVAVAHTADDQAETVLMHFLRGAGLPGLKGMLPQTLLAEFDPTLPLVRPLLGWRRADTEAYCRAHQLDFRVDSTNTDETYLRNRLRHRLLPALEEYNPAIRDALARTSQALQGDYEIVQAALNAAWASVCLESGPHFVAFDQARLAALSLPLRRGLLRRAAFDLRHGLRDLNFDALQRAAALQPVELAGGLALFVEAGRVYLAASEADLPTAQWPQLEVEPLPLTHEPVSLGHGWQLVLSVHSTVLPKYTNNPDPFSAWLDADLTEGCLSLRSPRPGDQLEPLGMPGRHVKLSDLFINLKIPRRARRRWPLICLNDAVAWVPGLRLGHLARVTGKTTRTLWLRLIHQV